MMLIARNTIIACIIEILFSFLLYLSQIPPIFLTSDQMNELLLAIFGAGMGALATGTLEYISYKRTLENNLLEQIEPLISGLSIIRRLGLEAIDDDNSSDSLYLAYLDEEELNSLTFHKKTHTARTELIKAIERCPKAECRKHLSNRHSHYNRYLDRAKSTIDEIVNAYLSLDAKFCYARDCLHTSNDINYLTFNMCSRARVLKQLESELERIQAKYRELIGYCRLYRIGDYSQADLIRRIRDFEKNWTCASDSIPDEKPDALVLFNLASEFAKYTNSKYYAKYRRGHWW